MVIHHMITNFKIQPRERDEQKYILMCLSVEMSKCPLCKCQHISDNGVTFDYEAHTHSTGTLKQQWWTTVLNWGITLSQHTQIKKTMTNCLGSNVFLSHSTETLNKSSVQQFVPFWKCSKTFLKSSNSCNMNVISLLEYSKIDLGFKIM